MSGQQRNCRTQPWDAHSPEKRETTARRNIRKWDSPGGRPGRRDPQFQVREPAGAPVAICAIVIARV
jgi:hypothetical protein